MHFCCFFVIILLYCIYDQFVLKLVDINRFCNCKLHGATPFKPRPSLAEPMKETVVAGAVSGVTARIITTPLDVIKIRFQLQLEPIRLSVSNCLEREEVLTT